MNSADPSTSPVIPTARDPEKGILFISVSQFGVSFSFNCIMSFMPFYILKISEYGAKETMLWIGLIMGVSPLVTAVAAPFWGSLTTRIRPKLLYQAGTFFNGVIFLLLGFAGSLPLLLLLRICQGFLGDLHHRPGPDRLVVPEGRLHKHMSHFQNSITAGQALSVRPWAHTPWRSSVTAPAFHHCIRGSVPRPGVLPLLRVGYPRSAQG